jgi:hypothetical protein
MQKPFLISLIRFSRCLSAPLPLGFARLRDVVTGCQRSELGSAALTEVPCGQNARRFRQGIA